ncbi:MAG: TAXI family TRAP transporter solute-binding subunit [Pseudorhodoplanes sp.]|nr:TAXI family TRAP transporter solute-binding subunit [Pseudorhodoplanes sp.]
MSCVSVRRARRLVLLSCLVAAFQSVSITASPSVEAANRKPRASTTFVQPKAPGDAFAERIPLGDEINQNTVAIVSGNPNATYLAIAYDLSAVLDEGNSFRVLPVIGKGGGQNIRDVRFLKGIDLGITQSNLLGHFRRTNELGVIDDKIVYIAKLFNEEMHLVVREESGITSIEQLAGKKVNFSDVGSGTQLSTRDIFGRLGVKAVEVNMGQSDAFEALRRGEIAATVLIAGKPAGAMAKLRRADGFRILPVNYPKPLHDDYLPATLTASDYPGLIGPDETIETVAVGAVLIAYNWPKYSDRYKRIEKFVERFFPRLAEFQKAPRHPKWKEANLAATLPGWTRFDVAEAWLAKAKAQAAAQRTQFEKFTAAKPGVTLATMSQEERDRLFQEFLRWSEAQGRK